MEWVEENLEINLELIGSSYRVVDNLEIKTTLVFSPERFREELGILPFKFYSIWPIVETVFKEWDLIYNLGYTIDD